MERRFMQQEMPNLWVAMNTSKFGWNVFIPNEWTDYAQNKGLVLSQQEFHTIHHRKSGIKSMRGLSRKFEFKNMKNSPWSRWHEAHTKPDTNYTISEYKKINKGKRPGWALAFSEKENRILRSDISKKDRKKSKFIIPEEFRNNDSWFVEREMYKTDIKNGAKYIVERIFDNRGVCNKVTMIKLRNSGGFFYIHQEDKITRHTWHSTTNIVSDSEWPKTKYVKLIKLPAPWHNYF